MGARIVGKLVKPGQRALPYMLVQEYFDFCDKVMPAFIGRDVVIEVYERKQPTEGIVVEIDSHLRRRLQKGTWGQKEVPPSRSGSDMRASSKKSAVRRPQCVPRVVPRAR